MSRKQLKGFKSLYRATPEAIMRSAHASAILWPAAPTLGFNFTVCVLSLRSLSRKHCGKIIFQITSPQVLLKYVSQRATNFFSSFHQSSNPPKKSSLYQNFVLIIGTNISWSPGHKELKVPGGDKRFYWRKRLSTHGILVPVYCTANLSLKKNVLRTSGNLTVAAWHPRALG